MTTTSYAVVDIETTGLDRSTDRIIEIAIIQLAADFSEMSRWHTLIDPGRPSDAVHIHGITDSHLAGAPRFEDVAAQVASQLSGRRIVGHNVHFDREFLNSEFARAGRSERIGPESCVCTMDQSRIYVEPGSHSLRGLADRMGIPVGEAHRSMSDAATCAHILRAFVTLEKAGERYAERARSRDDAEVRPAQWERAYAWRAATPA